MKTKLISIVLSLLSAAFFSGCLNAQQAADAGIDEKTTAGLTATGTE